jgi:hypothetical protein
MKHTPGPWVADLETYPVMVRSQTETWPLVDELGNEEERAGVFVANTGDNAANARLIAAAPDLLEALQSAERAMSNKHFAAEVLAHDSVVREMIRAAITKATGEQP